MIMREWIIRLVLGAFGLIIGLVVLEFGLSKFVPNPGTFKADYYYEPDKYIGWKGIPGFKGDYVKGEVVSDVRMNSHGFRDKERTYEKAENTFRILVLGDSFTEGIQVPLEKTFPYILEQKLNSEPEGGKRFEVINLGVSGFGTAQEYLTLKHYGLKYHPDLVILAFFIGNDVGDNSFKVRGDPYRPYFVLNNGKLEEIPFKMFSKEEQWLISTTYTKTDITGHFQTLKYILAKFFPNVYYSLTENSYYSSMASTYIRNRIDRTPWLANLLWKIGAKKDKPLSLEEYEKRTILSDYVYVEEYPPDKIGRAWQDAWDVTKALILRISNELKENNIGFLVVAIPEPGRLASDSCSKEYAAVKILKFDVEKPERILSEFLGENNINYLLLRPEFKRYAEASKKLYFPYSYERHFNVDGHALTATLIYKKLKDSDMVPHKGGHV
jgi:hypothetical protein